MCTYNEMYEFVYKDYGISMNVSRYTDVETLTVKLQFITPAFLGGADGKAELRSAPFKGLLRYWWRVLYSAKYLAKGFDELRKKEAEIFGASGIKGSKNGQAKVHLCIENPNSVIAAAFDNTKGGKRTVYHNSHAMQINVLDYLAYGHHKYKTETHSNEYIHTVIPPGSTFVITITAQKQYAAEVFQAFLWLVEYGGVGSKSRNGFGSMKILEKKVQASSAPVLDKNLWCVHKKTVGFSALSADSRLYTTKQGITGWENVLSELAQVYMDIREQLDAKHTYTNRGYLARPIITRDKGSVPFHIQKGRHPKCTLLGITEKEKRLYGHILTLPIDFKQAYPDENVGGYQDMITKIHGILDRDARMQNATSSIKGGRIYGA